MKGMRWYSRLLCVTPHRSCAEIPWRIPGGRTTILGGGTLHKSAGTSRRNVCRRKGGNAGRQDVNAYVGGLRALLGQRRPEVAGDGPMGTEATGPQVVEFQRLIERTLSSAKVNQIEAWAARRRAVRDAAEAQRQLEEVARLRREADTILREAREELVRARSASAHRSRRPEVSGPNAGLAPPADDESRAVSQRWGRPDELEVKAVLDLARCEDAHRSSHLLFRWSRHGDRGHERQPKR